LLLRFGLSISPRFRWGWDRARARPALGGGLPFLLFRLQDGFTVPVRVPGALLASKLVSSFLYGIKPNDPLVLAAAVGILLCAVLLAGYAPARLASRIEPMAALRHE
jgi:ABC-type antimicrobial peptide transport system permease subunit